jgi:hypothetical protein
MKANKKAYVQLGVLALLFIFSCKKTNDDTKFITIDGYAKSAVGKYIIYKLDSTKTIAFGNTFAVFSSIIKDSVAEIFKDNTGAESHRIIRSQFNSGNNTWTPTNTFFKTFKDNSLEYVENNLRYIVLVNPVSEEKTWKGNKYFSLSPYYPNNNISQWDYTYTDVAKPKNIGGFNYPNTITVMQRDSTENRPFYNLGYSSFEKGYEIYADKIGLVYKDIFVWEYQVRTEVSNCKLIKPKTTGTGFDTTAINCNLSTSRCDSLKNLPNHKIICDTLRNGFTYNGYGIKQTLLSHN